VGAAKAYMKTSTSADLNSTFSIRYESSDAAGEIYKDSVTIASLVIPAQIIGVSKVPTDGLNGLDGILGVGPTDLTEGTSPYAQIFPTVLDNLFSQGSLSSNEFALSFQPSTGESETNGEITFGGTDSSKYTGAISYVPITATSPASTFWGIDASVDYGTGKTPILKTTAGIVDSGTTLIQLATDAFQAYQRSTGAIKDSATGLLTITPAQFNSLQSLHFNIGGQTYELTPNAQIFPRNLNTVVGGNADKIYLIVSDLKNQSGSGLDFVLGQTFQERFYVVFDAANKRLGKRILHAIAVITIC
jgi:Eukaryotic aspartyl protease